MEEKPQNKNTTKELVLKRYKLAKWGLKTLFTFTFILNIILSLFADPKNRYTPFMRWNTDKNGGPGDFTISHSMTGDYSKSVAIMLIFICSLYYSSITHYQWLVFKSIEKNLISSGGIGLESIQKLRKYNQSSYTLATLVMIFLLSLTIFDVRNFKIVHITSAALFFLFGWMYCHILMSIETILVKAKLTTRDPYTKIYYWGMIASFAGFIAFGTAGKLIKNKKDEMWGIFIFFNVMKAVSEYLYVTLIILTVTSSNFERSELWDRYDLSDLGSAKLFSFTDLFLGVWTVIKHPLESSESLSDEADEKNTNNRRC